MKRFIGIIAFLLCSVFAFGQGNTVTISFPGAPTGACAFIMLAIRTDTGVEYNCWNGSWAAINPAGGGASPALPLGATQVYAASTTFGGEPPIYSDYAASGADACAKAVTQEGSNPGTPIEVTLKTACSTGSCTTACSVNLTSGFSATDATKQGEIDLIPSVGSAGLATDVPIVMALSNIKLMGPRGPHNAATIYASSAFNTNYASQRIFSNTGGVFTITDLNASGSAAKGCYSVTYVASAPSATAVIRGGEPEIQFVNFANASLPGIASLNVPRRALAGDSNTSGDSFCNVSDKNYAAGPTYTTFGFFNPEAYAAGFTGCSGTAGATTCGASAQIVAQSPLAYIGLAPWSTRPGNSDSGSCSQADDNDCCLQVTGLYGNDSGANFCQQVMGTTIEQIAFNSNGYPGVAGPACIFCGEGSGYWNDSSVVDRLTGWDYATWSGAGPTTIGTGTATNQNQTSSHAIESYAGDCTGGGGLNAALCNEKISLIDYVGWQRLCIGNITVNGAFWAAVDIEGQGKPDISTGATTLSAGTCASDIHTQSLIEANVIVGQQMPTNNVRIINSHGNTPAPVNVLISCDFNGGLTCPTTAGGTGLTTPAGGGNQTSDVTVEEAVGASTATIQNQITQRNWTDNRIQFYVFHVCNGSDSACSGTGKTEFSSSTQYPSTFGGGIDVGGNAYVSELANYSVGGTTAGSLVKCATGVHPCAGVTAATTDSQGVLGVCVSGCGTTGVAQIASMGQAYCTFGASVTGNDYVQISSATAGDCVDSGVVAGGSTYPTSGGQVLGVALVSGLAGPRQVYLSGPFTPAAGGSGISGGTANYIPLFGSATTITGNSHLDDGVTNTGQITSTEPITISGSSHGITMPAGTAASGAAGSVVYSVDSTNGYAEVNENNTGLSRVCTAANGICAGGGAGAQLTQNPKTSNYSTVSGNYSSSSSAETETIYTISSNTKVTHTLLGSSLPSAGSCELVANSQASAPYNLYLSTNSLTFDGTAYTAYPLAPGSSIEVCVNSAGTNYVHGRAWPGPLGIMVSNSQIGAANGGNNITTVAGSSDVTLYAGIITVSQTTSLGHVAWDTGIADATSSDYYMVGIMPACAAGTSCTPLATTGALAGGSTGIGTTGLKDIALSSSVILPPGQYIIITCGTATTWQAQGGASDYALIPYSTATTASVCSSSGFPSTVTMPSAGVASLNGAPQFTFIP